MIDTSPLVGFQRQGEFLYPDYRRFGLSTLPSTVLSLFAGPPTPLRTFCPKGEPRNVVLLVIDGFGYDHWEKYSSLPFLRRMTERGTVVPITTVFPSSTAPALTTLHTGLPPARHGLPEWNVYYEEIDRVIETLPFRPVDGEKAQMRGVNPSLLYSGPTFYDRLAREGISSCQLMPNTYAFSEYSLQVDRGGMTVGALNLSDLFEQLAQLLGQRAGPRYFYVHWGALDATAHDHGPHTPPFLEELNRLNGALEDFLASVDPGAAKETYLLVTADHGHIAVEPRLTTFLSKIPEVSAALRRTVLGKPVPPWGSPRVVFLSIDPSRMAAIRSFLERRLGEKAEVVESREALSKGWFGDPGGSEALRRRIGDLMLVARKNHTIWWQYTVGKKFEKKGMHGSLTVPEMLVPFAACRLSDL